MIYYSLSVLMNARIREILIISTPANTPGFEALLGNGNWLGIDLQYAIQPSSDDLAQAFIIGSDFIGNDCAAMVLGYNIFEGLSLKKRLKSAVVNAVNAVNGRGTILFGYYIDDQEHFGIVEFDENRKAIIIEEKPTRHKSNYCATGLYLYDNLVVEYAKDFKLCAGGT